LLLLCEGGTEDTWGVADDSQSRAWANNKLLRARWGGGRQKQHERSEGRGKGGGADGKGLGKWIKREEKNEKLERETNKRSEKKIKVLLIFIFYVL
jgi:hypothetical protein